MRIIYADRLSRATPFLAILRCTPQPERKGNGSLTIQTPMMKSQKKFICLCVCLAPMKSVNGLYRRKGLKNILVHHHPPLTLAP